MSNQDLETDCEQHDAYSAPPLPPRLPPRVDIDQTRDEEQEKTNHLGTGCDEKPEVPKRTYRSKKEVDKELKDVIGGLEHLQVRGQRNEDGSDSHDGRGTFGARYNPYGSNFLPTMMHRDQGTANASIQKSFLPLDKDLKSFTTNNQEFTPPLPSVLPNDRSSTNLFSQGQFLSSTDYNVNSDDERKQPALPFPPSPASTYSSCSQNSEDIHGSYRHQLSPSNNTIPHHHVMGNNIFPPSPCSSSSSSPPQFHPSQIGFQQYLSHFNVDLSPEPDSSHGHPHCSALEPSTGYAWERDVEQKNNSYVNKKIEDTHVNMLPHPNNLSSTSHSYKSAVMVRNIQVDEDGTPSSTLTGVNERKIINGFVNKQFPSVDQIPPRRPSPNKLNNDIPPDLLFSDVIDNGTSSSFNNNVEIGDNEITNINTDHFFTKQINSSSHTGGLVCQTVRSNCHLYDVESHNARNAVVSTQPPPYKLSSAEDMHLDCVNEVIESSLFNSKKSKQADHNKLLDMHFPQGNGSEYSVQNAMRRSPPTPEKQTQQTERKANFSDEANAVHCIPGTFVHYSPGNSGMIHNHTHPPGPAAHLMAGPGKPKSSQKTKKTTTMKDNLWEDEVYRADMLLPQDYYDMPNSSFPSTTSQVYSVSQSSLPSNVPCPIENGCLESPIIIEDEGTEHVDDDDVDCEEQAEEIGLIPCYEGDNFLHNIASTGDCELFQQSIRFLGSKVANYINTKNIYSQTPLLIAVKGNHLEMARSLIANGANVNLQGKVCENDEFRTPLHVAASLGEEALGMVDMLLSCEVIDVNALSITDRLSPLHVAIESHNGGRGHNNCLPTVQRLVRRGADPNLPQSDRDASKCRRLVTAKTRSGNTCLHIAAGLIKMKGTEKSKLFRLLVRHGADNDLRNNEDIRPSDLAGQEWREYCNFQRNSRPL
ncbi:hypothetical protein ScPMuIL_003473 [Solemya velum]